MTAANEQQSDAEKAGEQKKSDAPFFEVVGGNPTAVEIGILSAVLATAQGNAVHSGEFPTGVKDDWGSYEDRLRPSFGYNPSSFLNRRQY